ncbi:pro-neuregulin-3, membrane-bound isoform-like isoform X2 [Gymnodraco acuticeps]|uniref:Pro-neuregulin-3, membrane-bound isoform-like isoform X2 n=1 Tax=Gymnodraco acuticeps TaxID=8218 RepID=A0A6P8SR87_GYMAC|nr:pro-neuregulin-3, membrane-bound isoform-like isoform X2 [Gymnodraco acuticeps]
MESKEVYKRQVLSITSIAMAISLLGTLCMALYCRNKRRREKLQAHLKESRSLKNYTANSHNSHNALDAKLRAPNANLQMHEYFKRSSQSRQGTVSESSFAHGTNISSSRGKAKHPSGSLSHSPDQRSRASHWSAPRRTPPIPRGRLNPIGGSKYSGPAYQHLQEVDSSEREAEAQRGPFFPRCQTQGDPRCVDPRTDAFLHMQTPPVSFETSSPSSLSVEVRSGAIDPNPYTRSLRKPGRRHSNSPPPPFRSCSIPIIPSVQYHNDNEASCMQTSVSSATRTMSSGGGKEARREKTAAHVVALSSTSCSSAIGQERDEVALLLEEAQEQLRKLALANRKQEVEARETVCFLNLNGGSVGALSCNGPTQTQLLTPSLSHRDLGQISQ